MTIKEVYDSCTREQRIKLQAAIMNDGVGASSAWFYLHGKRTPLKLYRESIREHIKRICGLELTVEELFG